MVKTVKLTNEVHKTLTDIKRSLEKRAAAAAETEKVRIPYNDVVKKVCDRYLKVEL